MFVYTTTSPRRLAVTLAILILGALALPGAAFAEDGEGASVEEQALFSASAARADGGIGVEASALWPIFPQNLFLFRAAVPVAEGQHLLIGTQFQTPNERPAEGTFSSASLQVGWRSYLWKGLHLDGVVNAGLGVLRDNPIDGGDYNSFDVEVMGAVGYRLEFGRFYTSIQPLGAAMVVFKSNPWPIEGIGVARTEGPFYVGNVAIGWQF